MRSDPKVSVLTVTYNHECFIERAVRSALAQAVDFPIELVIGEDCSTDDTLRIVQRLQEAHPDVIRLLPRPQNLGAARNFRNAYSECRGQYIALLEGDDYWTDPAKLRRQVAALDADAGSSLCYHPVRYVDARGSPTGYIHPPNLPPQMTTIAELFQANHIQTCSVLLRRSALPAIPPWFECLRVGDWALFLLVADAGHVLRLDDVMADYRIHGGGVWTSASWAAKLQANIEMLGALRAHFGGKYWNELSLQLAIHHCVALRIQGFAPGWPIRLAHAAVAAPRISWNWLRGELPPTSARTR